jgi:hypothetical protein
VILTKDDLQAIDKIVDRIVEKRVVASELRLATAISKLHIKVDELTLMTGAGFNEVTGKFDEVYDRFDQLESKVGVKTA